MGDKNIESLQNILQIPSVGTGGINAIHNEERKSI